jgi:hypothetical protein
VRGDLLAGPKAARLAAVIETREFFCRSGPAKVVLGVMAAQM